MLVGQNMPYLPLLEGTPFCSKILVLSFTNDKKRNISQHGKMFLSNRCKDYPIIDKFAKGQFIKSICKSILGDNVYLFNEQVVQNIKDIDSIKSFGDKVGQYNIQNKILATLNNSQNVNISKIKRDFLTNSSCGVCGKSSLDALEIIKKNKTNPSEPKITKEIIIQSPNILQKNQSEFSKTGGIHASGLFASEGELISLMEDVGRHNALDKLIGNALINDQLDPKTQYITCSGRLNFELVQKVLMTDIGIMIGVGAPTSLAIDLANKFDITLIGFVKRDSFNIYTNNKKVIVG